MCMGLQHQTKELKAGGRISGNRGRLLNIYQKLLHATFMCRSLDVWHHTSFKIQYFSILFTE